MLKTCSYRHEEIVYEGSGITHCPVCQLIDEKDSELGKLDDKVFELENKIKELESKEEPCKP